MNVDLFFLKVVQVKAFRVCWGYKHLLNYFLYINWQFHNPYISLFHLYKVFYFIYLFSQFNLIQLKKGVDKISKVVTTELENHINFIAFNLAEIARRWSSVICLAGAPSTIASIFDFPWNISISFFASNPLSCLKVIK